MPSCDGPGLLPIVCCDLFPGLFDFSGGCFRVTGGARLTLAGGGSNNGENFSLKFLLRGSFGDI